MRSKQEFTELYNAHARKVFRLCLGYASGDVDQAKEWQQETFIKVWKHRNTFKGKANVSTWIYRIAVNTCLSDLRQMTRHKSIDHIAVDQSDDHDTVNNVHLISKMHQCIDQLTHNNKTLILMELEDIPQATIAETMGMAHGTLRTRLSRIRKTLLNCITNGKG